MVGTRQEIGFLSFRGSQSGLKAAPTIEFLPVDPVTLALNSATAFTAALALFLSRLDAHHRRVTEPVDFRLSLWNLSDALSVWTVCLEKTDEVMQRWALGELDDAQAARRIRLAVEDQAGASDDVLPLLQGETNNLPERYLKGWRGLRHLLSLYGPEVSEMLETAIAQRRALLDGLVAELPNLRAGGPDLIQASTTRLHLAGKELASAQTQLDKFVRDHFPPEGWLPKP